MKFGVREICEVVLKAKAAQKVGNKIFYAGEPVCYFDTLKTSGMEGAATTVYAQGGRGNARLMAWEGERSVTFTMEDALISPEGFMILSGAGLVDATAEKPVYQHMTETVDRADVVVAETGLTIGLTNMPYLPADKGQNYAYVMLMKNGEIISEPYIPVHVDATDGKYDFEANEETGKFEIEVKAGANYNELGADEGEAHAYELKGEFPSFDAVLVDYYVERVGEAQQIEITPDKFGGNYYLKHLLSSVIPTVQICLQNLLFLTAKFSLILTSLWHPLVILLLSLSLWTHSLTILNLTVLRKFSQQSRLLKALAHRTFIDILPFMKKHMKLLNGN